MSGPVRGPEHDEEYEESAAPANSAVGPAAGSPRKVAGNGRRRAARTVLIALLPLSLAALSAAGPGTDSAASAASSSPAAATTVQNTERTMDVRTASRETDSPAPAGVIASALRPITRYHTGPSALPDPAAGPRGAGPGSDASRPNPAALVGDIVQLPAGPLGIPGIMMQAYKHAAELMSRAQPGCQLPWTLLAGIGKIESGHAGGGRADADGDTTYRILGPVLDGHLAGNAVIHDTDGGAIDGDTDYDRAVGPMQFMPGTWAHFGADGNNDGVADPNNVYDATFAAGRLLCASGADLSDPANTTGAILTYNHSMAYVQNVQAWAHAYATGAYPTPSELPPIGPDDKAIDAPDDLEPEPAPDDLPDPPDVPAQDDGDSDHRETLPGTDIPMTTIEVPGLPDITVPCLIDCPPPPSDDDAGNTDRTGPESDAGPDVADAHGAPLDDLAQDAPAPGEAPEAAQGAPGGDADDAQQNPAPAPAPLPPLPQLPDLQDLIPHIGP